MVMSIIENNHIFTIKILYLLVDLFKLKDKT